MLAPTRTLFLPIAALLMAACGAAAPAPTPTGAPAKPAAATPPPAVIPATAPPATLASTLRAPATAAPGAPGAAKVLPPSVIKTGATRSGTLVQYLFELDNPNKTRDLGGTTIQLAVYDPDGARIYSQTIQAEALFAGQRAAMVFAATLAPTAKIARIEAIPALVSDSPAAEVKPIEVVSVTPISQGQGAAGAGNTDLIVELRNPNAFDLLNVFVPALGYNAADVPVAGGSLYVGFLRRDAVTPVRFFVTGAADATRWAVFPRPRGVTAYAPEPALRAGNDVVASQATLLSYKDARSAQRFVGVFQLQSAGQISVVAASDYQILAFDADKKLVAYKAGQIGAIFPGGRAWAVEELVIPSGATPVSIVVNARPVRLGQAGDAKPLTATPGALPAAAPLRVLVAVKNPGMIAANRTNIVVIGYDGAGTIVSAGKEFLIGAIPPNESGEVAVVVDGPARPARLEAFADLSSALVK